MESFDLIVGVLYSIIILFIGIYYANRKFVAQPALKKNFILSLCFKLISAIAFGCIYQFYYKYGDSINYHLAGIEYFNYVAAKPKALLDFIFLDQEILTAKYRDLIDHSFLVYDYFNDSNIMVHKFVMIIGFFAGYQYFPTCVLFSLISFLGCWRVYRSMSNLYPEYEKYFKISFLYIPSVIFWTAGIGKDAICIGFINLFASLVIDSFVFKKNIVRNIILSMFLLHIVLVIKSYIVLSFAPLFLYLIYSIQVKKISNHAKKLLVKATFFIMAAGVALFLFFNNSVTDSITNEVVSNALHLTLGQTTTTFGNESKYDLGITLEDIKAKNIKPFILPSIEVALFRPYIWEVNKPIIVLSFVESCFFLLFTFYVFVRGYFFKTIRIIYKNKLVLFCLLYTILFAFFVGLVSANFGTLIRYKTPFISYFLIALFLINDGLKSKETILPASDKSD